MTADIRIGDALAVLRAMPDASVHCVVTSPPYWGLRAYGGDPGMIGREPTFAEHIENLLAVFREVRRVLRPDGTLWLNYGDAYARGDKRGSSGPGDKQASNRGSAEARGASLPSGMKSKDLMGMPWRVAFALQDDGWWLRADICWHKSNPMPESAKDRPTRAHEFVFLMTTAERYFYDHEAVKEPVAGTAHPRASTRAGRSRCEHRPDRLPRYKTPDGWDTSKGQGAHGSIHREGREKGKVPGVSPKSAPPGSGIRQNESCQAAAIEVRPTRNLRDVWTIPTSPFSGWTETVDLVALSASQALALVAEGNASVGDICHIVSPDCPEHAGFPDSVPKGFCDGLPDHLLRRMHGSADHRAQAPSDAASGSALSRDHCPTDPSKPDCSGPSYSPSASPRSTEIHKMAPGPSSSPHATSCEGTEDGIERTAPEQRPPASTSHGTGGSRSEADMTASHSEPQRASGNTRKSGSDAPCQCAYY